ncbi:MAG: S8 family peptidase [Reichenbachiella sp.]|uniref:S8 family peptidase n=1 Tax=Reichenbachiella sp. TaxID=2184521 RepID=UPI003299ED1C
MNLTYNILFRDTLLYLCLFFNLNGICQLIPKSIPDSYQYLLSRNDTRIQEQSTDYILPVDLINHDPTIKVLRKLDGWIIIRADSLSPYMTSYVFPVNPLWKLSDLELLKDSKTRLLTIKITTPKALENIDKSSIQYEHYPYVKLLTNKSVLIELLNNKEVVYIGHESNVPIEESRVLDLNLNPNLISKVHTFFPTISGHGINIGIKEHAFDVEDWDLSGRARYSNLSSDLESAHATDMATIIGGAGVTFVNGKGVAQKVSLVSSGFGLLMPDPLDFYDQYDIGIQNHSYGGEIESFYGASAALYDQISNDRPHLLHVMSSGNSGLETPSNGSYKDLDHWANLTGNYKNAKNNIVVGAIDTVGALMTFSSVGPAADGRIKPEMVAYSTAGTSNATALVSGVASLLQEQFKKTNLNLAPSDLIKGLLINGATDVGLPGIDFKSGFGNLDAYESMKTLVADQFYVGALDKGSSETITIEIPDNAKNLKVTLVWNDPAGQANDLIPLVNDLNLQVVDPDGFVWLPWVLNHSASVVALESKATRSVDHINNVEQVTLNSVQEGEYQVIVDGDLITENQKFSLVYNYQTVNQFEWNYPLEKSNMPYDGETGSYFRWSSTFEEEQGDLQITYDQGETWTLLSANLNLSQGYFRWLPEEINSVARVKIRVGSQEFESEDFIVSQTLAVKSGFFCSDSLMIHWPPQTNVVSYEIFELVNHEFETLQIVSDTFSVLNREELKSSYLKVVPHFTNDMLALGSYLFAPEDLGTDCYLSSFYGFKNEEGILLSTVLTSLYGIDGISIERLEQNEFQHLHSYKLENQILEFQDVSPHEGANVYQVKVDFENGTSLRSDSVRLIYLNEKIALLYPNPIQSGSSLAIQTNLSGDGNSILKIFDFKGNELKSIEIAELAYIRIDGNLIPGIYLYTVENKSGINKGRLVIY